MEYLVIAAVVIVLALCLGADIAIVPIMLLVMIAAALVFIFGFFVFSLVRLIGTKLAKGNFTRIGRSGKNRFDTAFYMVDGEEYPNVFPCEIIFRAKLYRTDKVVRLRLDKKHGAVYDANALCCTLLGFVLSGMSLVMIVMSLLKIIGVIS